MGMVGWSTEWKEIAASGSSNPINSMEKDLSIPGNIRDTHR